MAITKQFLKSKPICKVTFTVKEEEANNVSLVGSWNSWNTESVPLKKLKNGTFKATLDFEKDKSYEFRYLVDGEWKNEEEADDFAWNDYAADQNSVLNL